VLDTKSAKHLEMAQGHISLSEGLERPRGGVSVRMALLWGKNPVVGLRRGGELVSCPWGLRLGR
jgi:hypothetical protein